MDLARYQAGLMVIEILWREVSFYPSWPVPLWPFPNSGWDEQVPIIGAADRVRRANFFRARIAYVAPARPAPPAPADPRAPAGPRAPGPAGPARAPGPDPRTPVRGLLAPLLDLTREPGSSPRLALSVSGSSDEEGGRRALRGGGRGGCN